MDTQPIPAMNPRSETHDLLTASSTGWKGVADIITKVDEAVIKDYKEDIDTILVFAGLYSAVLTGLLVESIKDLQPDSTAMLLSMVGQLTSQTHSYTFTNGFVNSTSPPPNPQPPPFTPSLAAKRVNVLWFASLMLSLISASYSILVKQWLREYLSYTSVSPEARLRERHIREPALREWKVFGIAAFLPLLLQLSLALFFVGLCVFTLNIHTSIGYTTIPLVAAWATLFFFASFAPILSLRCPYKTPSLKPVTGWLARATIHPIKLVRSLLRLFLLPPGSTLRYRAEMQWLHTTALRNGWPLRTFMEARWRLMSTHRSRSTARVLTITRVRGINRRLWSSVIQGASLFNPLRVRYALAKNPVEALRNLDLSELIVTHLSERLLEPLEVDTFRYSRREVAGITITSDEKDLDVLLAVDQSQKDDPLLYQICTALQERQVEPTKVVDFVRLVIASRLHPAQPLSVTKSSEDLASPVPPMFDLRELSTRTCTILMNTLAQTLSRESRKFALLSFPKSEQWMQDCIALLCSQLPNELSGEAIRAITACFKKSSPILITSAINYLTSRDSPGLDTSEDRRSQGTHLLAHLLPVLLQLDSEPFQRCCLAIVHLFCDHGSECDDIATFLTMHNDPMDFGVTDHLLALLVEYLSRQITMSSIWNHWHLRTFDMLCQRWESVTTTQRSYDSFVSLVERMLRQRTHSQYICWSLFRSGYYRPSAAYACKRVFRSSQDQIEICSKIRESLSQYLTKEVQDVTSVDKNVITNLIRFILCQTGWIADIVASTELPSTIRDNYSSYWHDMGTSVALALEEFYNHHPGEYLVLADKCLESVTALIAAWKKKNSKQLVDEALIIALRKLVHPEPVQEQREDVERDLPSSTLAQIDLQADRVFAIIVGIDDFGDPRIQHLCGAVRDAHSVREWLINDVQVPPNHIKMILNENATRAEMMSAIHGLTDDSRICHGDAIIVYYAGSGSEYFLPSYQDEVGRKPQQLIFMHKSNENDDGPGNLILGDEIDELFNVLATNKGHNLTLILDCGHSSPTDIPLGSGIARRHANLPDNIRAGLDTYLHTEIKHNNGDDNSRPRSHVHIAACAAHQTTMEGHHGGLFTQALLAALRSIDLSRSSYSALIRNLPLLGEDQQPQCEGLRSEMVLFDRRATDRNLVAPLLRANSNGSRVYVTPGGRPSGIFPGTRLSVFDRLRENAPLGILIVTNSDDSHAELDFIDFEETFEIPEGAVTARVGRDDLRLALDEDSLAAICKPDKDDELGLRIRRTTVAEADLCISHDSKRDQITMRLLHKDCTNNGLTQITPVHEIPNNHSSMQHILRSAAHFFSNLRRSSSAPAFAQQFIFECHNARSEEQVCMTPAADDETAGTFYVNLDDEYKFRLQNNSSWDLYASVFVFQCCDFAIDTWYMPPTSNSKEYGPCVQRGKWLRIGYEGDRNGTYPHSFFLLDGEEVDVCLIKIFLSTSPIDLSHIPQDSPFEPRSIEPKQSSGLSNEPFCTSLTYAIVQR